MSKKDINLGLTVIKNILNELWELFMILRPLIRRMVELEDLHSYYTVGTIEETQKIFERISEECKRINSIFLPDNFLDKLKN